MRRPFYILLLAVVLLSACSPEEVTYVPGFDKDSVVNMFTPYNSSVVDLDGGMPATPSLPGEQERVCNSANGSQRASSLTVAAWVQSLLATTHDHRVKQIAGTYLSTDQDGNPITLSGKLVLPEKGPVRQIVIDSHYTIGANFEAPSECFPIEGILATHGYAVVVPDYIGFGKTRDLPHPYMCAELTARNIVDMYFAVLPYLESVGCMPADSSVYLMGYSQGGATTLSVQYLLERDYAGKVKIRRNFAGAGPYDLAATYDKWMQDDITGIPCAVPMIIQGMNIGEHLGLDYSIFFKPTLMDTFEEYVNSKNYTVSQIGTLMGANRLSEIVTEECRNKRTGSSFMLYRALMRNSIAYLWQPKAPVYMFHSQDDDTVPFVNSQLAREQYANCNIQYNFGHYGIHMAGYLKFVSIVYDLLK